MPLNKETKPEPERPKVIQIVLRLTKKEEP